MRSWTEIIGLLDESGDQDLHSMAHGAKVEVGRSCSGRGFQLVPLHYASLITILTERYTKTAKTWA